MNTRLLILGSSFSSVSVNGSYAPYIHDRFCVDRTGFPESICREIQEGVFRCHLPLETYLSEDISLDCSDAAISKIAHRYEHQASMVRELFDFGDETHYYPESYIDFILSSDSYSDINGRILTRTRLRRSTRLLLAVAQISMLTSRDFGSSTPYVVPVEDILGLRTMWRIMAPPGSPRIPLMRGHARYNESVSAFNTTLLMLRDRTSADAGLLILEHLLVNVPKLLTALIAMGQMHIMGRFDYSERKSYLSLISDCLDAFQMMSDFGGDRAVPSTIIEFVTHAALSRDIQPMQRFHEPRLFVDVVSRNRQIGPGFENLRYWGFLTNDVTQYLQSYIRNQIENNAHETYGLESLEQVDLNRLTVNDYYFFIENLMTQCNCLADDLERDVIMKYVNFLAQHAGLDVPPEDTIIYEMGRDIIDRIPLSFHHALSVMYKAIYCLDHPHMIFVILKLLRFSQLEIAEYQYRSRDAFFAYMNTEHFESAEVDRPLPVEWDPEHNLVSTSIQFLCRSLYRCLGSRVNDTMTNETQIPHPPSTTAIAETVNLVPDDSS